MSAADGRGDGEAAGPVPVAPAGPAPEVVAWVERVVAPGGRVRAVVSLSQSGTGGPWRLDLDVDGAARRVLLKVGAASDPEAPGRFATEAAALDAAAAHGVAAPRPVAVDADGSEAGASVLVTTFLRGSSRIAKERSRERLRALGAAAASIHAVRIAPTEALPVRTRSLEGAWLGDVPSGPTGELFRRARARLDELGPEPDGVHGLVHGDLWHGNTMWDGDVYTGAIDWDFAGVGPAGVDLGSLRCDAAVMHGRSAADQVLAGWEAANGGPAADVSRWDLISGLATPPDMGGWLPNFHAQGRSDLTLEVVTRRRDEYLVTALDASGA